MCHSATCLATPRRCARTRKAERPTQCTSTATRKRQGRSPKRSSPRCREKAQLPGDRKRRFVVVREFLVREGRETDFERIFGPEGIWPDFLMRSSQYGGSELRLKSKTERRFRLNDYWESHVGFEAFRAIHQLDCDRFDQLIAREELV